MGVQQQPQEVYDGVVSFCLFSSSSLSSVLRHFYFPLLPKPFIHKHFTSWYLASRLSAQRPWANFGMLQFKHHCVPIILCFILNHYLQTENDLSFFSFLIVNTCCYSFFHYSSSKYMSVVSLSTDCWTATRPGQETEYWVCRYDLVAVIEVESDMELSGKKNLWPEKWVCWARVNKDVKRYGVCHQAASQLLHNHSNV